MRSKDLRNTIQEGSSILIEMLFSGGENIKMRLRAGEKN
jgi:hypothetical protein